LRTRQADAGQVDLRARGSNVLLPNRIVQRPGPCLLKHRLRLPYRRANLGDLIRRRPGSELLEPLRCAAVLRQGRAELCVGLIQLLLGDEPVPEQLLAPFKVALREVQIRLRGLNRLLRLRHLFGTRPGEELVKSGLRGRQSRFGLPELGGVLGLLRQVLRLCLSQPGRCPLEAGPCIADCRAGVGIIDLYQDLPLRHAIPLGHVHCLHNTRGARSHLDLGDRPDRA
jgi:hypothetical protein